MNVYDRSISPLGSQLVSLGMLAKLIVAKTARQANGYSIAERVLQKRDMTEFLSV